MSLLSATIVAGETGLLGAPAGGEQGGHGAADSGRPAVDRTVQVVTADQIYTLNQDGTMQLTLGDYLAELSRR